MENNMFCFQCEQTADAADVQAEQVSVASRRIRQLQDQLTGALIGLARAAEGNIPGPSTDKGHYRGLFTTVTNVNFNNEPLTL